MPSLNRTPPPGGRSFHPNTPVNGLGYLLEVALSPAESEWEVDPDTYSLHSHHASDTLTQTFSSTPTRLQLLRASVDLHGLEYASKVDDNLICPICRFPLVEPVTTKCQHTFCKECFDQSYQIKPICPIDRLPLRVPDEICPAARLILNQLDALEVVCPNTKDGCSKILARSMVQNHVEKYCSHALVQCSEAECDNKVFRKDLDRGCTHYPSLCPDCTETLMEADIEHHRLFDCAERKTKCDKCNVEILRYQADMHENECEEAVVPCKWSRYGCLHQSKRKELPAHAPLCDFKIMGPIVENMKEEIHILRGEVQSLKEKDKVKERRINFLESDKSMAPPASAYATYLDSEYPVSSTVEYPPYDSRDQYLLSLLESQEGKVDRISAGLTELEAKQTMMLFNETLPIKEQLAEIRSTQGVLGMHVRWLMNFRIQERRPGATSAPNSQAGPSTDSGPSTSGSGLAPPRRLSDNMRENITKL